MNVLKQLLGVGVAYVGRATASFLLLSTTLWSAPALSVVDQVCIDRFQDAGAVPGTPACFTTAIASPANLGNYGCTGTNGIDIANEYCGIDEDPQPCPNGGLPDFDTGECPPLPELQQYDENLDTNTDCTTENPVLSSNGPVEFVVGPGSQFHPNAAISNATLVTAALTGINLVSSAEQAQSTGDSSLFFSNLQALLLPLFGTESVFTSIFQSFSQYVDQGIPGGCP